MAEYNDLHITVIFRATDNGDLAISCDPEIFMPMCRYGHVRFLEDFGFHVSPEITYCIAKNDLYSLKFQRYGLNYSIFISNNKDAFV